jgi:hypothetical protein
MYNSNAQKQETRNGKTGKMSDNKKPQNKETTAPATPKPAHKNGDKEVGGPKGLEPTRYGDWERKGIISDF